MSQSKKPYTNSEDRLKTLGVVNVGFELYDGMHFFVRGLKGDPDYRWEVKDKRDGQEKLCSSLVEAVQWIEKQCLVKTEPVP